MPLILNLYIWFICGIFILLYYLIFNDIKLFIVTAFKNTYTKDIFEKRDVINVNLINKALQYCKNFDDLKLFFYFEI